MAGQSPSPDGFHLPLERLQLHARNSRDCFAVSGSHCRSRRGAENNAGVRSRSEALIAVEKKGYRPLIREFHSHHCLKHTGRDRNA